MNGHDWHTYTVTRTLLPDQPGTKTLTSRYGNRLVRIRYRRSPEQQRTITTVEVVVDERPMKPGAPSIQPDAILSLRVEYDEKDLRKAVKAAGGTWDAHHNVWNLAYEHIVALKLTRSYCASMIMVTEDRW